MKKTVKKTTTKKPEALKVDDWVLVTRKGKKKECKASWVDNMDKCIGKKYQIVLYDPQRGAMLKGSTPGKIFNNIGFIFPIQVLKKVPAPRKKPIVTKKAVEAVADKILDAMPAAPVMWKTQKQETRWEKIKKIFKRK